jgi:hypothetical protein
MTEVTDSKKNDFILYVKYVLLICSSVQVSSTTVSLINSTSVTCFGYEAIEMLGSILSAGYDVL